MELPIKGEDSLIPTVRGLYLLSSKTENRPVRQITYMRDVIVSRCCDILVELLFMGLI